MPEPDESSHRALRRLDKRLDRLAASRAPKAPAQGSLGSTSAGGYRMLGEVLGGVLGGLGLGWLFDRLAHTGPWGLIGGMLIGSGVSIYAAVKTAIAMSDRASQGAAPTPSAPGQNTTTDDEDDD
jgi:ATP synthase protein I